MAEHSRDRSPLSIIAAMGLLTLLPGCVVALAGAAGTAGGYAAAQERSIGDSITDATLKSEITQSWDKYNFDMSRGLNCDIYEGRVLITGRVPKPEWRDEAVKRAWQVKGVKQVYNEVEIGPLLDTSDNFNDDWQVMRGVQDFRGAKPASLAISHIPPEDGCAGKVRGLRLHHDLFIEGAAFILIVLAAKNA